MANAKERNPISEIAIPVRDEEEQATLSHATVSSSLQPSWFTAQFSDRLQILDYIYFGTVIVMYGQLTTLIQVKFQNKKQSPFETHGPLMIMSVIALSMAAMTSWILFYTNGHSGNSNSRKQFSPIYQTILLSVLLFSMILAPMSLMLVLFIPQKLTWIGYLAICMLFVAILAYNFIHHISSLTKKIFAAIWKLVDYFKVIGA